MFFASFTCLGYKEYKRVEDGRSSNSTPSLKTNQNFNHALLLFSLYFLVRELKFRDGGGGVRSWGNPTEHHRYRTGTDYGSYPVSIPPFTSEETKSRAVSP